VNPIRAWNSFFFGRVSARPLAVFRILIGLIAIAHVGLISLDMVPWLTDAGYLRGSEARELAGTWRRSPLQWIQDPVSVRIFLGAVAAAAVCVTLGWRTRIMSVLLYLGVLSLHHRMLLVGTGADTLLLCMLFYLMLSPSGAAYSLDARRSARQRGTLAEPLIVPWAQRLAQVQLAVIYLITALLKTNGATWPNGSALYYVMHNPDFNRFTLGISESPLVLNALTHVALLIEFALAFLLWFRASRPYAIVAGIVLHGGILLTVNIPLFGETMVATYVTFLTASELDTVLRVLDPRRWFRATEPAERSGDDDARIDGPRAALRGPHFNLGRRTASTASTTSATARETSETADEPASLVGR
jgi:hypothetical protein